MVCLDESNRQLIEETRTALPVKPGEPRKVNYEYRRNGIVDFFMMFEPLAGQRHIEVRTSRARKDFAYCIKQLADVYYPDCVKIVLVIDNLNTYSIASLYEIFPPEEALRIANKLEIHFTPKHGSWLDMAEIEIGVMSRQCPNGYLLNIDFVTSQVSAWCSKRNAMKTSVNWHFTTADARFNLKSLYPVISQSNFLYHYLYCQRDRNR